MRAKFLVKFENFVYGNNFSIDRTLKLIALLSFYSIVLNFLYNQRFYSRIGINFQTYSETSDYLPSFFSKIYGIIIFSGIIFLYQLFAVNSDLRYEEELEERKEFKKQRRVVRIFNLAIFLSFIPLVIDIIRTIKKLYENDWFFLKTSAPELIIIITLAILVILFRNKIKKSFNFSILFFSITFMIVSVIMGHLNGDRINNNIIDRYPIYEFQINNEVFKTDKLVNIVIGETKNFLFIKNLKSRNISIYDRSKISKFKIVKRNNVDKR